MSLTPDQPGPGPATAPADSGLRCPNSEYNLTGLTENRCPECGAAFDPEELRRILTGKPEPVPGWNDRGKTGVFTAFLRVCWLTWFQPSVFAQRFPFLYDPAGAAAVWLMARVSAGLVIAAGLVVGMLLWPPAKPLDENVSIIVGGVAFVIIAIGSMVCEVLVGMMLAVLVRPKHRPPNRPIAAATGWSGLVAFHGGFLIMSTAVAMCTMGLARTVFPHMGNRTEERLILPVELGPLAWWSWALGLAVTARARPTLRLVIARLLIPVIGLTCALLASACCGIRSL
jgi:hypothetical protein